MRLAINTRRRWQSEYNECGVPKDKQDRRQRLAEARGGSMNRSIDERTTAAIAQFDVETRFRAAAARGDRERGLALLEKLDRKLGSSSGAR